MFLPLELLLAMATFTLPIHTEEETLTVVSVVLTLKYTLVLNKFNIRYRFPSCIVFLWSWHCIMIKMEVTHISTMALLYRS
jgi:hypothetical protein